MGIIKEGSEILTVACILINSEIERFNSLSQTNPESFITPYVSMLCFVSKYINTYK